MQVWELSARENVRDLIARYNAYGDGGKMAELMELFAEDAVMDMDGDVYEGREAIAGGFRSAGRDFVAYAKQSGAPRDLPVIKHYTATSVITVEAADTARCQSYFLVLMHQGLDHWGTYTDVFREIDGRWYIQDRRVKVEGASAGGKGALELARLGRGGF